jgi:hypothetical protein
VEKTVVSLNWVCRRLSGSGEGGHTAIEAPSGRLGKPIKHLLQLADPPRAGALNMKTTKPRFAPAGLLRRVQIALKPASKTLGLHGVFIRGKGLKYVIADSAFKRMQVDARAC